MGQDISGMPKTPASKISSAARFQQNAEINPDRKLPQYQTDLDDQRVKPKQWQSTVQCSHCSPLAEAPGGLPGCPNGLGQATSAPVQTLSPPGAQRAPAPHAWDHMLWAALPADDTPV